MLRLFTYKNDTDYSLIHHQSWGVIAGNFSRDLGVVETYYRNRESKTNSNNPIARLINLISVDNTMSIYGYLTVLDAVFKHESKQFNIVSNINRGEVTDSYLVKDEQAIFLSVNFGIDLLSIEETWQTQIPIKPIQSEFKDLSLPHPTKMNNDLLAIYEIDVRLLMVMYRYWYLTRVETEQSTHPSFFVYQYVMTNMIRCYLDIALTNMFFTSKKLPKFKNTHPFDIRDPQQATSNVFKYLRKNLHSRNIYYEELLQNIPNVTYKNAYDYFYTGNILINRQNRYAIFLSRGWVLLKVILSLRQRGLYKNYTLLTELKILMLQLQSNRVLLNIDYGDLDVFVDYLYHKLFAIAEKRSL